MPKLKTLKSSIIIYFSLLFSISIVLLGAISYVTFSNFTKKEMIKNTSSIAYQANKSLDLYLEEIKNSLYFISINQDIIATLKDSMSSKKIISYDQNRINISIILNNIFSEKTDIKGYFIYNYDYQTQYINSGSSINFKAPFLQKVWSDFQMTKYALKTKFYGAHKPNYYSNYSSSSDENVITIAANIKDPYDPSDHKLYGIALYDYNISKLKDIYDTIKSQLNLNSILIDDKKQIIYKTDSILSIDDSKLQLLFNHPSGYWIDKIDGKKTLISYTTSSVTGWKTVFLVSLSQLDQNLSIIRNSSLLLISIMIIVTIICSIAVTIRTTEPILTLVKFMNEIGKGSLDIRIKRSSQYAEINVLNKGFNNMLDKINELVSDLLKRQLLQKEAEYAALQAKVNPHFLYNTLQSISSLSILERNKDIETVTHSLRELLHYSLYQQNEMVPLHEEIECIQNYLRVQNICYDGRLDFHFQIDESVLDCLINKFTFQPIIENAIYHGLDSKEGKWLIEVIIFSIKDLIHIEFRDNGIGMTELRLLQVKNQLARQNTHLQGIGLSNILDRLELKFGSKAKIVLSSQVGKGTSITLIIPKLSIIGGSKDVYDPVN